MFVHQMEREKSYIALHQNQEADFSLPKSNHGMLPYNKVL